MIIKVCEVHVSSIIAVPYLYTQIHTHIHTYVHTYIHECDWLVGATINTIVKGGVDSILHNRWVLYSGIRK